MERPRLVVNFGGKGELYLKLVFLQNFSVIKAKITRILSFITSKY